MRALPLLVLVLGALGIGGCRERERAPPRGGATGEAIEAERTAEARRLVFGVAGEPATLCLHLAADGVSRELAGLVTRDVSLYEPSWTIKPDLAEALPTDSGAPDGRVTTTWSFRKDARWEDGQAVSARDVILPWRLQRDPAKQQIQGREDAARMDTIEAVDEGRGFKVTWTRPVNFALHPRTHIPLPAHVLESDLIDPSGALRPLSASAYCKKPLSNGPFRLVDWKAGEELRFARNPHASPAPILDEILVRVFPNEPALEAALAAGVIDAVPPDGGMTALDAIRFMRAHPAAFALASTPGQSVAHFDFNMEDPILKDVRVREAIALAVPRQQIFEAISDGTYEVADSYLPNRHWAHADVTPITYDPVRAAALLDDAGFFAPTGGGTRARTDGTQLRLTVDAGSDKEETEELLARVKDALANVGIELVLRLRPFKDLSAALASERALRQITFYAWASDPSIVGGALWRADRIPRADNGYKGANTTGYQNDVVTQLLKEVEQSVDEAVRKQKLAAVQQQLRRDLPVLPLYVRPQIALSRKGVLNLRPTGTVTPLAWNAAQWDVAPRAEP